jgi:hypothetical protein
MGHFIRLNSGKIFDYGIPAHENDITLYDIAASLSKIPRFLGSTRVPFYVAQHAVNVSIVAEERAGTLAAFYALHHDDHEFVTGDIPAPLKDYLYDVFGVDIREIQDKIDEGIFDKFRLTYPMPGNIAGLVKEIDTAMVHTEGAQLVRGYKPDGNTVPNFRVEPVNSALAEKMYINRHMALFNKIGKGLIA